VITNPPNHGNLHIYHDRFLHVSKDIYEDHSINYGNYMLDQKYGNAGNCLVFVCCYSFVQIMTDFQMHLLCIQI